LKIGLRAAAWRELSGAAKPLYWRPLVGFPIRAPFV
jgi:hypothetical protein